MQRIEKGRYILRLANGPDDLARALHLRGAVFRAGGADGDDQDAACVHALVEDADGRLHATFRLRRFDRAADIAASYAAQRYDLTRLAARGGGMAELGRFCLDPDLPPDPDLLRLAWAFAARLLDDWGAGFLFGCTSLVGTEPDDAVLGLLTPYAAPMDWRPGRLAAEVHALPTSPRQPAPPSLLPPLLRSYIGLGGRVSDHAVIDRDLGTHHLFTGLDISTVPPARAAALRDILR